MSVTVSSGAHSHAIALTVAKPATPTLQVDDAVLQALPGTCGGFQRTRVRAFSGGVDISRLLTFSSSDTSVVAIDTAVPGQPAVIGIGAGTAKVYVRSADYASVSVTVSSTAVGLTAIYAGVVTGA